MKTSKVVLVMGPTASGKSDLGLTLASSFGGEVIVADSRQFYKELSIGTAKPSKEEQAQVIHHLVDCASIDDSWNAGRFSRMAREIILSSPPKLYFVVGGTGLYLQALTEGLDEIPSVEDSIAKVLKEELKEKGLSSLYERLQNCDPEFASGVEAEDTQRILRGLGVFQQTGRPLSSFWQKGQSSLDVPILKIAINWQRDDLYKRINDRVLQMLQQGLEDEVKDLRSRFSDNEILSKTIGYREWIQYDGESAEFICQKIQQNTRHFAKRQLTWFRRDPSILWFAPEALTEAYKAVETFIG